MIVQNIKSRPYDLFEPFRIDEKCMLRLMDFIKLCSLFQSVDLPRNMGLLDALC